MSTSAATTPFGPDDPADVVARLYTEYASDLTRFCRGNLRSIQEAEDAVQTTFVHAVQALRRGVVPECESAWLYTIAKNVCRDQRRANGLRLVVTTELEAEAIPAREDADAELTDNLNDALAQLPERQRRAFLLREWRGLSSHEVASNLGLRDAETYALLTRARRSMASMLAVATGRTTLALHLGPLLLKLRALFAGTAAKTAATTTLVVAVAGGGLVVGQRADPAPDPGAVRSSRASVRDVVGTSAAVPAPRDAGTPVTTRMSGGPAARAAAEDTSGPVRGAAQEPGIAMSPGPAPTPDADPTATATTPTTHEAAATASTTTPAPTVAERVAPKVVPKVQRIVRQVRLPDVTVPNVPDLLQPVDSPVDALVPPVTDVDETVEKTLPPLPEVQLPPLPAVPPVPPLPPAPPLLP